MTAGSFKQLMVLWICTCWSSRCVTCRGRLCRACPPVLLESQRSIWQLAVVSLEECWGWLETDRPGTSAGFPVHDKHIHTVITAHISPQAWSIIIRFYDLSPTSPVPLKHTVCWRCHNHVVTTSEGPLPDWANGGSSGWLCYTLLHLDRRGTCTRIYL